MGHSEVAVLFVYRAALFRSILVDDYLTY